MIQENSVFPATFHTMLRSDGGDVHGRGANIGERESRHNCPGDSLKIKKRRKNGAYECISRVRLKEPRPFHKERQNTGSQRQ